MSKIAFLSGKGGSGKTSLSLSIASILSSFGLSVLLIDCDLITNGATYFFEDNLTGGDVTSCSDILQQNPSFKPMVVNKYFHFIPSITNVRVKKRQGISDYSFFANYITSKTIAYDIVLFDCAAGYSELSDCICQQTESNVFVMEADAISSAALRSLFLKIGSKINNAKNYQIFNKVTMEEYSAYSKITGGTVFPNISPIQFDWKIRKAFALAEIPEIKSLGAEYIIQVLDMCRIIVADNTMKLKISEIEDSVKSNYYEIKMTHSSSVYKSSRRERKLVLIGVILLFIMACILLVSLVMKKNLNLDIGILAVCLFVILSSFVSIIFEYRRILSRLTHRYSNDEANELVDRQFILSLQDLQKKSKDI